MSRCPRSKEEASRDRVREKRRTCAWGGRVGGGKREGKLVRAGGD